MKKKLVILGAGESGVGAALLAKKEGYEVMVSDRGAVAEKYKDVLCQNEINWEEGKHTEELILDADEVVKSPGIPDRVPLVKKLVEKGIPVISEIEFAGRYTQAKLIGITGSNGKTTTASLCYQVLKRAGLNVGLAGNIGKSFALQVAENDYDYYVLELSSFQLDGIRDLRLKVAMILNITPDHLDRYDNEMDKYANAKLRIAMNQQADDVLIYCKDDEWTRKKVEGLENPPRLIAFTQQETLEEGAWMENEKQLVINIKQTRLVMGIHELALQGKHNVYNSMAAAIAARTVEIEKDTIRESLSDFQGIEHRLEKVTVVNQVEYINDSKATNVNSTWYALESMTRPVVWIVGGQDKGNDYSDLKKIVTNKVKAIVCLGLDNSKIMEEFGELVEHIAEARTAVDAVKMSKAFARPGDSVLLSPACASFDLFESYEDRGKQFKQAVRSL